MPTDSFQAVRAVLTARLAPPGVEWLAAAVERVAADPAAIRELFPAVGRECGRAPLIPDPPPAPAPAGAGAAAGGQLRTWTMDDAARVLLLGALPLAGAALAGEVVPLYRYGDAAEKRGVLRALDPLDSESGLDDGGLPLIRDALATNDTRLVSAAMGPYARRRLDDHQWRHAVLKCVFMGIPLSDTAAPGRSDDELVHMLMAYATERRAARRPVPADVWLFVPVDSDDPPET